MSTDAIRDLSAAHKLLEEYKRVLNADDGAYVLNDPQAISIGWSFSKLFPSLEFAQKLYDNNSFEIDSIAANGRSYKFITWLWCYAKIR